MWMRDEAGGTQSKISPSLATPPARVYHSGMPTMSRNLIAANVRLAREARGWTQQDLADALGWHRPAVSRLESGRCEVLTSTLDQLASVLGVGVSEILSDSFEIPIATP